MLDDVRAASAAKFRRIRERIPPVKWHRVLDALDVLIVAVGKDTSSDA